MKKIIADCDGVLLDWGYAFEVWMADQGYIKLPDTDHYFSMGNVLVSRQMNPMIKL